MGYIITLVLLGGIIAFSIVFARGMIEQHMEDARQKMAGIKLARGLGGGRR